MLGSAGRRLVIFMMIVILAAGWVPAVAGQVPEGTPVPVDLAPKFGLFPIGDFENGYFEVEVAAGDSVQLAAGVINIGEVSVGVRTYATNAFNPPNGGFAAGSDEDEATGATLWLDYVPQQFVLEPNETREQAFTVAVPEGTPPGQYIAALVVQTDGAVEIPGNDMFTQVVRGAMSVEITVPGKQAPSFEVLDPVFPEDSTVSMLSIPVSNTGNVLVKPAGEVVVTTSGGEVVLTSSVEMGSVYAGSTVPVQILVPDQLPYGEYVVSAQLKDANSRASGSIAGVPAEYRGHVVAEAPTLEVADVEVVPSGSPLRYVDISGSIVNNGSTISAADVMLDVKRDGHDVESYPLARNMALSEGSSDFAQRYVPMEEWEAGVYSFEISVSANVEGTETLLGRFEIEQTVDVP